MNRIVLIVNRMVRHASHCAVTKTNGGSCGIALTWKCSPYEQRPRCVPAAVPRLWWGAVGASHWWRCPRTPSPASACPPPLDCKSPTSAGRLASWPTSRPLSACPRSSSRPSAPHRRHDWSGVRPSRGCTAPPSGAYYPGGASRPRLPPPPRTATTRSRTPRGSRTDPRRRCTPGAGWRAGWAAHRSSTGQREQGHTRRTRTPPSGRPSAAAGTAGAACPTGGRTAHPRRSPSSGRPTSGSRRSGSCGTRSPLKHGGRGGGGWRTLSRGESQDVVKDTRSALKHGGWRGMARRMTDTIFVDTGFKRDSGRNNGRNHRHRRHSSWTQYVANETARFHHGLWIGQREQTRARHWHESLSATKVVLL